MPNQEDETQAQIAEERGGTFMSPEGVLMLALAIMLDIGGLAEFIPIIGTFVSFLTDIIGFLVIGGWMMFRFRRIEVTRRAAARMTRLLRWIRPLIFIGEFIPFVGILPLWTLLVYLELRQ